MKILIYGHKGWIGQQFVSLLQNTNIQYILGTSRCDNIHTLQNEISHSKPTHIVSFIGRTHGTIKQKEFTTIDYLEQDGKLVENVRDNLFSPIQLALLAKKYNIHYTYLGTGCIFKFDDENNRPFGKEENGFTENDKPNFFGSSYSIVKGFTDQLMHLLEDNVLNLRIRMPITGSVNKRNFITKITTYEKICSVPNSMTVLPELLPIALDMIKNNHTGTINLTNPGLISHNEILTMFKQIVDPEFVWNNFSIQEQKKILASDRSNNFLNTNKLQTLYPTVKNIKDAVRDMLYQYKNTYKKYINLLVTGCCGFIGSNFVNFINKQNKYNIINIDAMHYCADENNIHQSVKNSGYYTLIKGNINDLDLNHILQKYRITQVVHFAAQSHVQNSFNDSLTYTNDNILATHKLLEACRIYNKINKFIHVSTDEVYGESMIHVDEQKKTEHSILCPTNPYAGTKAAAELLAQSYNHSFGLPIIITRGNNVYGPNQYPEKLVPKFIKLLKENKKVTIQGNGSCLRAFLHSYDTATAFYTILEKGTIGEIYNIGCDEGMEYSVLQVAQILIKMIKNTQDYDKWIEYIEDRPFNDKRYYISNKKLKDLGWNITINFENGLKMLLES